MQSIITSQVIKKILSVTVKYKIITLLERITATENTQVIRFHRMSISGR